MAAIGYGRTRQELLITVKKILDEDGRKTPFKDNKPGRDYYRAFVKRHHSIIERTPMQLGKERAVISNARVSNWYQKFVISLKLRLRTCLCYPILQEIYLESTTRTNQVFLFSQKWESAINERD